MNLAPAVESVTEGMWSIPVALPRGPLPFVFAYVFATPRGPVVVDPGWDAEESYGSLGDGLIQLGFRVSDLYGVLATHHHRDHSGLASRLRRESGAWIGMHSNDADILARAADRAGPALRDELQGAGVPPDDADLIVAKVTERFPVMAPLTDVRPIEDGDYADVPGWRIKALWTPGHTPGHLCFVVESAAVLLSGDHLLPRITPNVSRGSTTSPDPLRQYLASLHRLLADDVPRQVLPAHEWRFANLDDRVGEVREHHASRLREVRRALAPAPMSLWELASAMKWFRPWAQLDPLARRSALGETRAHLAYLEGDTLVTASGAAPIEYSLVRR